LMRCFCAQVMYRSFQQNIPDRGAILSARIKLRSRSSGQTILPRCHAAHDLDVVSTLPAAQVTQFRFGDGHCGQVEAGYDHAVAVARMTGNAPKMGQKPCFNS
jgi:hypothetical protein